MTYNYIADSQLLTSIFHFGQTRILDVVDVQEDFTNAKHGKLPIHPEFGCKEDASEIIEPMNQFFIDLPPGVFDYAFVKFDTHFANEYPYSPESKIFPNPHCLYGTTGWNLSVNITPLTDKYPTFMLAKNEFDMWGSNPVVVDYDKMKFTSNERNAYNNLFKFIPLQTGDDPERELADATYAVKRDLFLEDKIDSNTVVVMCGVASDVCNYKAMLGYLERGATVIIAEDLTRGIGGEASPAPNTGSTTEVIAAIIASNPAYEGQLYMAQSADILKCLNKITATPAPVRVAQPQRYAL